MIDEIKKKIKSKTIKMDIDEKRIEEIINLIEKKLNGINILSFFVSDPYDNYGQKDLKEHISIDILSSKGILGIIFNNNHLKYDFTLLDEVHMPDVSIQEDKIKVDFPLTAVRKIFKINSYNPEEFDELLSFIDAYEKLKLGE